MLPEVQVLIANEAWCSSLRTSPSSAWTEAPRGDNTADDAEPEAQERDLAWSHRSGRCEQRDVSRSLEKRGTREGWEEG